jgi:membrane-associated phospholipid phosphatase
MEKEKLAVLISRVFDPSWESVIILYLASRLADSGGWQSLFFLSFTFVFLLPFLFFLFLLKRKEIGDWDITKRQERYKLFNFIFASLVLFLIILYFFYKGSVFWFYLKLTVPLILFYVLTFKTKPSGHMLVNTLFFLMLWLYTRQNMVLQHMVLYLALPVLIGVGWSRYRLKKHTVLQIVLGGVLSLLILLILL